MKRILYIATSNISKRTGGGIANLALLNSLLKDYDGLIDVIHYEDNLDDKYRSSYFHLVPSISRLEKVRGILKGRIHRFTPWLMNFLALNAVKYSHCIINSGIMGEYVEVLHQYGIKVMIVHHNYECEFQMDNRRPSTLFGLTSCFVKKSEKKSYHQADYNVFLSNDDIDLFHRHYPKGEYCNECAVGIFNPDDNVLSMDLSYPLDYCKLCICGSLESVQTRRGLKDFRDNYLEILMHYYGNDFLLKIAGRNPSKKIYQLSEKYHQIKIIANPPVISDVVKDCGIFICPTNVGGGIKLRILDGLSIGMPILTHEISARGYNCLHQYPWFQIYKDESSFQYGLDTIVHEIKLNNQLKKEIRDAYKKHFSFEMGDTRFRSAINDFLRF